MVETAFGLMIKLFLRKLYIGEKGCSTQLASAATYNSANDNGRCTSMASTCDSNACKCPSATPGITTDDNNNKIGCR